MRIASEATEGALATATGHGGVLADLEEQWTSTVDVELLK
jgi:hypothetical protein